ncbi:MAG: hypothetical protein OEZ43_09760 [Gammaproteobacteria bacterium]|nr:hypothetical protein [Gammaproteobacteria bacterium]
MAIINALSLVDIIHIDRNLCLGCLYLWAAVQTKTVNTLYLQLAMFLLLFVTGLILRQTRLADKGIAASLLNIVVNFGLPLLILGSVTQVKLAGYYSWFPFIAATVMLSLGAVAYFFTRHSTVLEQKSRGVVIVGVMIMNLSTLYPFLSWAWGDEAVARLALVDFGNGVIAFSVVVMIASWHGRGQGSVASSLILMLRFLPFWALWLGLLINGFDWYFPESLSRFCLELGKWIVVLVFLALGLHVNIRMGLHPWIWRTIAVRVIGGLLLSSLLAFLLPLDPLSRAVVIVAGAAPIGFNTLVFAIREDLDQDLAATMASLSVLAGMIYIPLLIVLLERWLLAA